MPDTATNIRKIALDELCNLVSPHQGTAIKELVRRANEMYSRLEHFKYNVKLERQPMPEPVEVWLQRSPLIVLDKGWRPAAAKPPEEIVQSGPYQIIPGMMSLDELANHAIYIVGRPTNTGSIWSVEDHNQEDQLQDFTSARKAQWEATQLVKEATDEPVHKAQ